MADAPEASQQLLGLRTIAILPWRRVDTDRQADRVDRCMKFGRQSAARAADRGSFSPPFAPLASAWTFEIVLSIRT